MIIGLTSLIVDDQDKALKFYTEVLGFQLKHDIPAGEYRWLTVVSPERPDGTELFLEPNDNPAGSAFQQSIFEQSIAAAQFNSVDIQADFDRLKSLGVQFTLEPTDIGPAIMATFNDTCGNLINIIQEK